MTSQPLSLSSGAKAYEKKNERFMASKPNSLHKCLFTAKYDEESKTVRVVVKNEDGEEMKQFWSGTQLLAPFWELFTKGNFNDEELRVKYFSPKALNNKFLCDKIIKAKCILNLKGNSGNGALLKKKWLALEHDVIAMMADPKLSITGFSKLAKAKEVPDYYEEDVKDPVTGEVTPGALVKGYTVEKGIEMLRKPDPGNDKTWFQSLCKKNDFLSIRWNAIWSPAEGQGINSIPIDDSFLEHMTGADKKKPWVLFHQGDLVVTRAREHVPDDLLYRLRARGKDVGPISCVLSPPWKIKEGNDGQPMFGLTLNSSIRTIANVAELTASLERREEEECYEETEEEAAMEREAEDSGGMYETQADPPTQGTKREATTPSGNPYNKRRVLKD